MRPEWRSWGEVGLESLTEMEGGSVGSEGLGSVRTVVRGGVVCEGAAGVDEDCVRCCEKGYSQD